ncbi:restriction endonuclease subunit S [Acinetobacter junii]|uniref:restriction endonuclease subunit S n=1 Tax=Acinetobacter junii TaxID=40215 RepID=UPI00124DB6B4|nr:restriction endonuclease subunit S [Acinetobacter junii]
MAKYQAYAEYKDSGVQWLGEIPSHWKLTRLKFLAKIRNGQDYKHVETETGFPVMGSGGQFTFSSTYMFNRPSVLLGRKGTIDKPLYIDEPFWTVDTMYYTEVNKDIDVKYFYYLSKTILFNRYSTNTALPSMTQENLNNFEFSVPPSVFERNQIRNFLDHETTKIDHLIEKQHQLIELLKEKRQAVISHAVTKGLNPNVPMKDSGVEWLAEVPEHWNMAPVRRYLVEHRQGYYTTESYVDEGLKLLRITDLRDLGEINISNCPMVNESDTTHLFKLQKGDVVFARTGGAGSFGVITEDYENLIYASYLIRFRFMNKIFEPDYLRFLFQSDSFQLSVKQNIHGGVNQNIHAEDIKNTVICAPSLSEQKEIIEYLENQCLLFENLIYKASYSVKLMQERRTALISSAVTGKIDVRNWQAPTLAEAKTELSA